MLFNDLPEQAKKECFEFFPIESVITDPEILKYYGKDWTSYYEINSSAVFFPHNIHQVQQLVLWARKYKISLIPSGGRTGLSGGAVATNGECIVSFEKMNRIVHFDPISQKIEVESGCLTETIQNFANEKGLFYPVDFAARGSSQIGGNVATNAGGIKVLRYGSTRDWVLGLVVVTGTGEILELNKGLIKNATGYDLRHLFIGSEGTLGFIVKVTLQLTTQPLPSKILLLKVPHLDSIMKVFSQFQKNVVLNAFEMMDQKAFEKVRTIKQKEDPFQDENISETVSASGGDSRDGRYSASGFYYIVLEAQCANDQEETQLLEAFSSCLELGWLQQGIMAQTPEQARSIWSWREDISESLSLFNPYKNDISVTVENIPLLIKELDSLLHKSYPHWERVWFGHIGDGNLHINILRPTEIARETFVKECQAIDPLVFSLVQRFHGSISAEHGVGLSKKKFLHFSRSPEEMKIMKSIKTIFDPDQIMNPGKML